MSQVGKVKYNTFFVSTLQEGQSASLKPTTPHASPFYVIQSPAYHVQAFLPTYNPKTFTITWLILDLIVAAEEAEAGEASTEVVDTEGEREADTKVVEGDMLEERRNDRRRRIS